MYMTYQKLLPVPPNSLSGTCKIHNKQYKEYLFAIPYFNNDTIITNKLYIIIVNTDAAHPSGIFQVELEIGHFDIFGGDR